MTSLHLTKPSGADFFNELLMLHHRQSQYPSNLPQGGQFILAYYLTTKTEESTLLGGMGNLDADLI